MSVLETVLTKATEAAAERADVPLAPVAAKEVASAIAAEIPAPAALETLWPQLARYGVAMVFSVLVGMGLATDGDLAAIVQVVADLSSKALTPEVVTSAVGAAAPVFWRIATTYIARRKVAG